jgi:PST family polysaccharide transporter
MNEEILREPATSTATAVTIGAAWFMLMRWTVRLIGVVSTAILARILLPADFGLLAVALTFMALLGTMTDLGLRTALIRQGSANPQILDTVFTVQLLRTVIISVMAVASSFVLPGLVGDERLRPAIWVLAAGPLIGGLSNPRMALFERRLNFVPELIVQVSARLCSTVTTITLALLTHSYWALVCGVMVQMPVNVLAGYMLAPYRPRFSLRGWRELLHFSGWLSVSYTLDTLGKGMDELIVGSVLNLRATGIYNVGSQLAGMPLGEFLPAVNRALLPGLMRFKDDLEKLRSNSLEAIGFLAALSMPIAVGFAFVAPEFVRIIYGSKWIETIPLVQVLSLSVGIELLGSQIATLVALATGRTKLLFFRSLVFCLIRLPAFVIGAKFYGLQGAAAGYFIGSSIYTMADFVIMRIVLKTGLLTWFRALWRSLLAVAIMALVLFVLENWLVAWPSGAPDATSLAIKVVTGALVYGAVRLLIWRITKQPHSFEIRTQAFVAALANRARGYV